jgi:hypothetical protein
VLLVAVAAQKGKTDGKKVKKPVMKKDKKAIEIKCIPMPTRSKDAPWPKQPSDTILDFDKLEQIKENINKRNAEIKKKQKPATLLNLDDLKAKFSSKLAAQFKDFSMADMKKRKKMMVFKKKM